MDFWQTSEAKRADGPFRPERLRSKEQHDDLDEAAEISRRRITTASAKELVVRPNRVNIRETARNYKRHAHAEIK